MLRLSQGTTPTPKLPAGPPATPPLPVSELDMYARMPRVGPPRDGARAMNPLSREPSPVPSSDDTQKGVGFRLSMSPADAAPAASFSSTRSPVEPRDGARGGGAAMRTGSTEPIVSSRCSQRGVLPAHPPSPAVDGLLSRPPPAMAGASSRPANGAQGNALEKETSSGNTTPPGGAGGKARDPGDYSSDSVAVKGSGLSGTPPDAMVESDGRDDNLNVFHRAHERGRMELEGQTAEVPAGERGGCCMQLGYTMRRVLTLMYRELCSTICEFFIPIIFVVGTAILWAVFGSVSSSEAQYFSSTNPVMVEAGLAMMRSSLCNSSATADATSPIPQCTAAFAESRDFYCPRGRGIPAGLCYNRTYTPLALGAIRSITGNTSTSLSLDSVVMLHWLNMDDAFMGFSGNGRGALQGGGLLYFAPDTPETRAIVDYFNSSARYFRFVYGGIFRTSEEAANHVRDTTDKDPPNWGIIQVDSFTRDRFKVDIRLNASALPLNKNPLEEFYFGGLGNPDGPQYVLSGFLTLQSMLYELYATSVLGLGAPFSLLTYTPMPTIAFKAYRFLSFGAQLAPLILVLGYLYPVSQLTKRIVLEKELRIREAMLIMGLSEGIMYLAWFLIYFGLHVISSLIMAIIMRFTYLPNTSLGFMFFMLVFFSTSTITLAGALAALFSKARLAALLAPLIYFVTAVPLFAMQSASSAAKTGIMILSPSALAVGMDLVFLHEARGGADTGALRFRRDNPNLLAVFVFMFFDILLYLLLMLYFDQVIPKDWGMTRNPLFFIIDPIKWCCCRHKAEGVEGEDGRAADGVFEPIDNEAAAAVRIRGLRKKFKRAGKSFLAVNNLYWSLKEGEISVLLGHNGAGKSTTMNLMTGMLAADAGDCTIYGHSIMQDRGRARQEIGLCPQHNILWPNLTVREHLDYFAAIKGLKGAARREAVARLLAAVDLEDKEHYMAKMLSGGMKRKLSVAIAFAGGSRLVFLDEPTAGMDVGARRRTWGLLKEMSKRHTILLSTHFMDEADLLGNTVAIMNHGRLQCSGSNMFLKSQLGIGFVLTMSVISHVDRTRIEAMVHGRVPGAESMGSGAGEVSYRLPMDSRQAFPELLSELEQHQGELGINAYSLSATTLEEVFLRIANGERQKEAEEAVAAAAAAGDNGRANNAEEADGSPASAVWNVELVESPCTLWRLQFRAMILKRFWNALRDRRTQFFQIACPVLCVFLAMLLTLINVWNNPVLDITSDVYDETVAVPVAHCDGYVDTATPFSSSAKTVLWDNVVTADAFSQRLLDTYNAHTDARYGGLVCNAGTIISLPTAVPFSGIFYNSSAPHEAAIMTANFYNARTRLLTGNSSLTMEVRSSPMPRTRRQEAARSAIYSLMIATIIMIPFTFIPSTFVGWIVKERECKARHLQNVSGLNFYIYWMSNFVFDLACYIITMFLVIAVFAIFKRTEYIAPNAIGATIVAFLLYGISGILLAYALSFLFSDHSTAQNVVMLANFIIGFLLVLAVSALSIVANPTANKVSANLRWVFRIVPSYCVGECINNMATVGFLNAFGRELAPWDMSVVGWPCVYMAIEVPLFLFITLFVDHPGRRQRSQRLFHNPDAVPEAIEDEDPDVVQERRDVLEDADREKDLVNVKYLRKQYPNGKVAVRNLTFGVKAGEVFGFLGTNGAGKTTTISILCQEFYPTSGRASVCGYDIVTESQKALRCIGYCPQFDATLDLLTVEEHLQLYAGVRGISPETRDTVVEGLMRMCELTRYRKTKSHELSGGNRRKLSVAISLIGGPRVVFLDEPSAGMDPVARRGLWNAIETVADNCSVVLTTHHLEEVEALAHRVAIMVDGTLRCIGDKTRLKQKFGTGYEVTVRVGGEDSEPVEAVKRFFAETFASCELMEERSGRLTYQLPNTVKLSEVFTQLQNAQRMLGVTDYNVSQTSIEQVFMRISEDAEMEQEAEHARKIEEAAQRRCCSCCYSC